MDIPDEAGVRTLEVAVAEAARKLVVAVEVALARLAA